MKAEIHTLIPALAVVLLSLLLCACPAPQDATEAGVPVRSNSGASPETVTEQSSVNSLFAGTGYDRYEPLALDIPHDVDRVFLKKLGTEGQATLIESYHLGAELTDRVEYIASDETFRAFVKGHPGRDECLLISHRQDAPEEPIRDVLWRVTPEGREELDYLTAPGLPVDLPHQAFYNTSAEYNWAGDRVVVVLNTGGVCILDEADGTWRYARAYPLPGPPAGPPTGQACRTITDNSGRDLFFLSRWYIGRGGDWCTLGLLDLDTGEWVQSYEILAPDNPARQWVIYDIAATDLMAGPWLVRGSRAPNVNTEHKRVPRLAWIDTSTGHVELPLFHGEPYWPMTLDPSGGGLVYLDQQRRGIVHLDLEESWLEVDPRWYNDEATIYVSPGADEVYVWSHTELFRAQFGKREKVEE